MLASSWSPAADWTANYDEAKIPPYTLPELLISASGEKVADVAAWRKRRAELLRLFESEMFGRAPGRPPAMKFVPRGPASDALGGKAVRKEVDIQLSDAPAGPHIGLLLYLPKNARGPVPVFLGLNFGGNQSIHPDPAIRLSDAWMREGKGITNHQATEATRGGAASRWPVEMILERGYGVVTAYYGDIDPDFHDGFTNGVHALFPETAGPQRAPDAWGSIAAWAWGLSRALDYLETDRAIDSRRVAVLGHSRLGKTSLWAGAVDERFAIVISNDSGCGGAALSRRAIGETVWRINTSFPHWFCGNFKKYNDNENTLPFDQHMLIALMAPRPVYVASAEEDRWADPKGEFLSALHAEPVYQLYRKPGLGVSAMPELNHPVGQTIGYHIRTGQHDVTAYDWEQYLAFADRHFGTRPPAAP